MSDDKSAGKRAVQARLDVIEEEMTVVAGHARELTRAIGEFRHELRRNAEAGERNPGHQVTRVARRLRTNLERTTSELETTRARIERLRAERERLLAGLSP